MPSAAAVDGVERRARAENGLPCGAVEPHDVAIVEHGPRRVPGNTPDTGGGGGKGGKVRSKKSNPGVDLTAMVDLAFLLITFFILTTTLSKPQSMDLALPDNTKTDDPNPPETPAWRTLTVVLGKNDKLVYYIGMTDAPYMEDGLNGKPKLDNYGGKGIRKVLLTHNKFG